MRLLLLFFTVSFYFQASGQVISIDYLQSLPETSISKYDVSKKNDYIIYLPVDYSDFIIDDELRSRLKKIRLKMIERIDLVYTQYARLKSFDQKQLNRERLEKLLEIFPEAFDNTMTEWNFIEQTGATNFTDGQQYFHGFVIYLKPPRMVTSDGRIVDSALDPDLHTARELTTREEIRFIEEFLDSVAPISELEEVKLDTLYLMDTLYRTSRRKKWTGKYLPILKSKRRKGKRFARRGIWGRQREYEHYTITRERYKKRRMIVAEGDTIPPSGDITYSKGGWRSYPTEMRSLTSDSLVFKVLERNRQWDSTVIVEDVTGSMYPYLAQTFLWRRLSMAKQKVTAFVFFNDGDRRPDGPIGRSGGAYYVDSDEIKKVEKQAFKTMAKGSGGAAPENNIEAALFAIKNFKKCKQIVMIADNWANIRDEKLLEKLIKKKVPVRVIVCGTTGARVNIDYIELARRTNGSLHTIQEDFTNLARLAEGETIVIGIQQFKIKKGKLVFVKHI